jgi:ATP-dependent DNA helicase RecG
VVSPGSLVPPITLDILRKGAGGHASRNPLIVRVLVIVGLMREVGEGRLSRS